MAIGGAMIDPYATLNVSPDAPTATIRSSYKRLMLQCHPDKVHDEALRAEKAAQFEKVQQAYELLIDPRRRRKYDDELLRNGGSKEAAAAAAGAGPAPPPARSSAPPPSGPPRDERDFERQRERSQRHERRQRKQEERASKGEAGFGPEEFDARHQTRFNAQKQEQEAREAGRRARYNQTNEDTRRAAEEAAKAAKKSHTGQRYAAHGSGSAVDDTSPRKPPTYAPPPASSSYVPPPASSYAPPNSSSYAPPNSSYAPPNSSYAPPPPNPAYPPPPPNPAYPPPPPTSAYPQPQPQPQPQAAQPPPPPPAPEPRTAPMPGPQSSEAQVRKGYEERLQEERERLAEVKRKMGGVDAPGHSSGRRNRSRENPEPIFMQDYDADMLRRQEYAEQQRAAQEVKDRADRESRKAEKERQRRERENIKKESSRFRNPDMPSPSPPNRRSSHSTTSRDDSFSPTTPQRGFSTLYGSSVPHNTSPNQSHSHPLRRRHSISDSPSLEKQQARMARDKGAGAPPAAHGANDSGYSSPSPDTATSTPEKMMPQNPIVRNGADGTPGSNAWKKYTFEVYVREDEANAANGANGSPHNPAHGRRKPSTSGSPSGHHAELPNQVNGAPLPPDFWSRTAGLAGGPAYVVPGPPSTHYPSSSVGGAPIETPFVSGSPSAHYTHSHAASHSSSTGSTSSPRLGRHHSHHHYSASPHGSPKVGDGFGGMPMPIPNRSSTNPYPGTNRRTAAEMPHYPASFQRQSTY